MPDHDGTALRTELIERFRDPESPLDDSTFDLLARRVFTRNFTTIPAYAAYCRARGRTPDSVAHWLEIPAVPTAAFKELVLRAEGMETQRVFRTSGTTRGPERRGEHHVADLELYRASLRSTFRAFLLPDDARLDCLSLMPPRAELPDSSLAYMISDVIDTFGGDRSSVFAHAERPGAGGTSGGGADAERPDAERPDAGGIDFEALTAAAELAVDEGRPVLLLGTSAAFIHWLDHLAEQGRRLTLPEGSRLMDTGGYKGKGRETDADTLRDLYRQRLGLAGYACVNEYGMTELLSQQYDDSLRSRHRGLDTPPRKQGPPWLRTVAVDPETLVPLPPGRSGILRHLDLANLDNVAAIQTEDFGRVDEHGLVLEGRATSAPPRGCSIAMDLLLGGSA